MAEASSPAALPPRCSRPNGSNRSSVSSPRWSRRRTPAYISFSISRNILLPQPAHAVLQTQSDLISAAAHCAFTDLQPAGHLLVVFDLVVSVVQVVVENQVALIGRQAF